MLGTKKRAMHHVICKAMEARPLLFSTRGFSTGESKHQEILLASRYHRQPLAPAQDVYLADSLGKRGRHARSPSFN